MNKKYQKKVSKVSKFQTKQCKYILPYWIVLNKTTT